MSGFIAFVVNNWEVILGTITAVLVAGASVAKLTPTPKDDGVFAALLKALNLLPGKKDGE